MSLSSTDTIPPQDPVQRFHYERMAHWDSVARTEQQNATGMRACYHNHLHAVYRFLIPEGQRVLELGCAEGDLLAALKPTYGVGVDFSSAMLELAQQRHPDLYFLAADVHALDASIAPHLFDAPFDVIILSDLINDLCDVLELLTRIKALCAPHTRLIINFHSQLWEHPFRLLQRKGTVRPRLNQNWFTPNDVSDLLHLAGFECIRAFDDFLWPFKTPGIATLFNRYLAKLWPFSVFDLTHFMICRPKGHHLAPQTVSVIIPARNEAGNIEAACVRTPELGAGTELIFVEGHSSDDTWQAIQDAIARHPERTCKALRQPGKGKGDAVRMGFEAASGDILMILDADLTMPPETLPQFYEAIASGTAEFVNGVRLVYPQETKAMRFVNLLGNKFFSLAFSWLLGRTIKDTLCGTKVLSKVNYTAIAANRNYFGEFDPFGDFDLLFGAAKLNLKIMDLPVRYRDRTYGDTNISRWRDGWILLKMVRFAMRRIKFVP